MGKEEKDDDLSEKERLKSTAKKEKAAAKKEEEKLASKMTNEENDIPQAAMMTTLERQTNRSGTLSVPGAHAIRGPGMADGSSSDASSSLTSTTASRDGQNPASHDHHTEPVLTATLVEDHDDQPPSRSQDQDSSTVYHVLQATSPPLARAEPADDSLLSDMEAALANLDRQRNQETKQPSPNNIQPKSSKKRWIYFLLVLSLMIISGLTVALIFALRKDPPPKGPPDDDEKKPGENIGGNIGGGKNGNDDRLSRPGGDRFDFSP